MKIRVAWGILVLVAGLGLAAAASAQEGGAQSVDAAWMKAMKAGDLDAIVACYASDAVMWLPGAPEARGTKAIHDAYAGLLSANTVTDVSITDTHYETWQNLSLGWGHFMMTLQPKAGGAPTIMGGRFLDVAKKIDGKWRYVADHASVEPPPPPPADKH